MGIKERIHSLCKQKNITAKDIEERFNLGKGYISKVDKSRPNMSKIAPIAEYLGVSVDYLLTGKETTSIPSSFTENDLEFVILFNQLDNDMQNKILESMKKMLDAQRILKGE